MREKHFLVPTPHADAARIRVERFVVQLDRLQRARQVERDARVVRVDQGSLTQRGQVKIAPAGGRLGRRVDAGQRLQAGVGGDVDRVSVEAAAAQGRNLVHGVAIVPPVGRALSCSS